MKGFFTLFSLRWINSNRSKCKKFWICFKILNRKFKISAFTSCWKVLATWNLYPALRNDYNYLLPIRKGLGRQLFIHVHISTSKIWRFNFSLLRQKNWFRGPTNISKDFEIARIFIISHEHTFFLQTCSVIFSVISRGGKLTFSTTLIHGVDVDDSVANSFIWLE